MRIAALLVGSMLSVTLTATIGFGKSLFPTPGFPVGPLPVGLGVGDLNSDGETDLVVTDFGAFHRPGGVSVLLGLGGGEFEPEVRFGAGENPIAVDIGDFNRDHISDLAVANFGSDNVSILVGMGDGSFVVGETIGVGDGPSCLQVGDLNGDGDDDVAVCNFSSDTVSVFLGKGDGSFSGERVLDAGESPMSLLFGDFNLDAKRDLAVVNVFSDEVSVLLGNGDGSFGSKSFFGTGIRPMAFSMADVNADGRQDLAVANAENPGSGMPSDVSILLGKGDGSFEPEIRQGGGNFPHSTGVGDFNLDGIADLAVLNGCAPGRCFQGDVSILLGNGDGTFLPESRVLGPGEVPNSLGVEDFDGDGFEDLAVVTTISEEVGIIFGKGDGSFETHLRVGVGSLPSRVNVGDFNNDKKDDVLVIYSFLSSDLSLLLGKGDGSFLPEIPVFGGETPLFTTVGDLNSDGNLDLVLTDAGELPAVEPPGEFLALLGQGDGTFGSLIPTPLEGFPFQFALGDLNGDQDQDVAVLSMISDDVAVLLGTGEGTFEVGTTLPGGAGPNSLALGDYDNDGNLDIAVSNLHPPWRITVHLGEGHGTFGVPILSNLTTEPQSLVRADFNGDSHEDLAVVNRFPETVSMLMGNGDGTFGPEVAFPVGNLPEDLIADDVNGDGRADLVATNIFSDSVSVLIGLGDGTFLPDRRYRTHSAPVSVASGDFTGDGRRELVVANLNSDDVSVLINQGPLFVGFDIKPTGCPNSVPYNSQGLLPAAITGSQRFDVTKVDRNTIEVLTVKPLKAETEDVGSNFFPLVGKASESDCSSQGPDGFLDIKLKFDAQEIIRALEENLGRRLKQGDTAVLPLRGKLLEDFGGIEIQGEDVVFIAGS